MALIPLLAAFCVNHELLVLYLENSITSSVFFIIALKKQIEIEMKTTKKR